ncbi:MAG TPA: tryptophan synthase subunit alpha [Candidatus Hydrogenedentes bacterium]|nr:tryptophan synthase subunit alpha [Candidatus Hydrogenedentota bacterium]
MKNNRIEKRFQELAQRHKPAFIPYITAGDPTLDATEELVAELERAGSDVIELGVPFSDPVADGVVNQEAAQRALAHGTSLRKIIARVKKMRARTQVPLVLFTYVNPVLAYGLEAFANDAADAGVDGVLCVDLPPEEAEGYKRLLDARGIATIFLIAPTSSPERIALIARQSSGFIYYVSRTGVTGERADIETSVSEMVAAIKRHASLPVAVGFGISTPEQSAEVAGYADGVIVGSAIVRLIGRLGDVPDMPSKVGAFAKTLADAAKSGK